MKNPSGFYSSLGLLVLLNAVVKPLWIFAIDRQVQIVVGTETYGVYFSLFSLAVVLCFLADWGFTSFFNQRLATQEKNFSDLPGRFLLVKLLFVLMYCIVLVGAALLTGIKRWDILFYTALIQLLISFFLFFRAIITAHQWFRADAWLSVTDKTLMIAGCGVLLYVPGFSGSMTIERFLLLQIIFMAIAVIVAFAYLFKKGVHFFTRTLRLPDRGIFRQALPFGIVVLLMSAHSRIDAFLLERIHYKGAYEAGIYAAAFRLLDAANMWGYLIASFMLPYIARRWSENKEIDTVVFHCRHFMLMFSAAVISIFVFLAPWIEGVLYHHDDTYASSILQWCLPALAGYSLVQVYGTVLTATGRVRDFCYIVFFGLLINIVINLVLIPSLGAKGCCIAALCSQLFTGIAAMLYAKQKLLARLHLRSLLIYIFTGILLGGFFYTCREGSVSKWLQITAAMVITVAVMLWTKPAGLWSLIKLERKQH